MVSDTSNEENAYDVFRTKFYDKNVLIFVHPLFGFHGNTFFTF